MADKYKMILDVYTESQVCISNFKESPVHLNNFGLGGEAITLDIATQLHPYK